MIQYREIAFTVYPVTRMARARRFYEKILGLKSNGFTTSRTAKFVEYNLGPGTLAIGSSPLWKPSRDGASVALEVRDFDAAVAHLRKHRVKFLIGPLDSPKCRMVTIRDPDGNKLTLHQRKSRRAK